MKQPMGMNLAQITEELEFQSENRQDFNARTETSTVHCDPEGQWFLTFSIVNGETVNQTFKMNSTALSQLCSHLSFPYSVFKRISNLSKATDRERKALAQFLAVELQECPSTKLVRTRKGFWEDPQVVAILSQNYKSESNFVILTKLLGLTLEIKGLTYSYGNITDNYLTIQMMGQPDKDGMAAGIQFDWSETGSPSFVRPVISTGDGLVIVPSNHWMEVSDVSVELAKQCVTGAKAAVKKYLTAGFGLIPSTIDIKALFEENLCWVDKDAIRKIFAHFNRAEQRTVQSLVRAVAKYAQTAQKLTYDERVEFQCEAGKMLDITNETLSQYFDAGLMYAETTTPEENKDERKETTKQGQKPTEKTGKAEASDPAKSGTRRESKPETTGPVATK